VGFAPTIGAPWQGKQRNRIEHRLFAVNTQNWRGKPLTSYEVIGQLNANTTHQNRPHRRVPARCRGLREGNPSGQRC
jgi:hypothetical protein